MKKMLIICLAMVFIFTLTSVSFAGGHYRYNGGHRGGHNNGSGALIVGGVVLGLLGLGAIISASQQPAVAYPSPPSAYYQQPPSVYVGKYPALAGGNVVMAINGLAYDIDITARGNTVRLGPGSRADFPVFFDEATAFSAVVLDNGRVIGTAAQSFYTNGNPQTWYITGFNRLQK